VGIRPRDLFIVALGVIDIASTPAQSPSEVVRIEVRLLLR
jgi:hypothetical protein